MLESIVGAALGIFSGFLVSRYVYKRRLRQLMAFEWPKDAAIKLSNPDDPFSDPEAVLIAARADYLRGFWAGEVESVFDGVWVSAHDLGTKDVVELRRFEVGDVAARKSPGDMSEPRDRTKPRY